MANIQIKDDQLKAILSEVETELQEFAKSELGLVLEKGFEESSGGSASPAPEGSPEGSSGGSPGEESGGSPGEASASEGAPGAPPGAPAESAAAAPPMPDGSAPPSPDGSAAPPGQEMDQGEAGVVDAAHDHQALTAAMSQLSPEDVMAVYLASKQVLLNGHGEAGAGPDQGAPPPGAGSPPPGGGDIPPPPPQAGQPMQMSEGMCKKCGASMSKDELHAAPDKKDPLVGTKEGEEYTTPDKKDAKKGGPINTGANMRAQGDGAGIKSSGAQGANVNTGSGPSLGAGASRPEESDKGSGEAIKSEEIMNGEDLKKSEVIKELTEKVELLSKVVEMTLGAPVRKAVTKASDLAFVPKTNEGSVDVSNLSREEITAKLNEKSADPKLSKSDRGLIMDFYERNVGLDKIAHLFQ
jgi:hypothetical protein